MKREVAAVRGLKPCNAGNFRRVCPILNRATVILNTLSSESVDGVAFLPDESTFLKEDLIRFCYEGKRNTRMSVRIICWSQSKRDKFLRRRNKLWQLKTKSE